MHSHIVPNLLLPQAEKPPSSKTMATPQNAATRLVDTSPVPYVPPPAKSSLSFIVTHLSSNPDNEPVDGPAPNQCTFCQIQSIEQAREKERFSSPACTPNFQYVECSFCGSLACSDCISEFYLHLTETCSPRISPDVLAGNRSFVALSKMHTAASTPGANTSGEIRGLHVLVR